MSQLTVPSGTVGWFGLNRQSHSADGGTGLRGHDSVCPLRSPGCPTGGCVVLACQKPLLRLLNSLPGIDQCVDRDKVNVQTHVHAPLLDLPFILGTTLENVPAQVPYLSADGSGLVLPGSQESGARGQGSGDRGHGDTETRGELKT